MQLNKEFLDSQRLHGDEVADVLVESAFSVGSGSELYALLKLGECKIAEQPGSDIKTFLVSQRSQPSWFNERRLQKGQRIFEQYASQIMALLGAMSLPYCYAGSPGNKALYLSDKMRNSPGKRLMDTASFVINVLTPGSFDESKTAHIHINKVRLIHALSRFYLRKQSGWDMKWGIPINQEDMAGTNLAFSYVILQGMQLSGLILSQQEKEDFLFAWRYIGYLLNIDEELLPASFAEAGQLTAVIKRRNFKKTEEGSILTRELLDYYKKTLPEWHAELVSSQVRFYLGKEVSEYIGLAGDPIRDRIVSSIGTFNSLQNMLTVQRDSYQNMLFRHLLFKQKFN